MAKRETKYYYSVYNFTKKYCEDDDSASSIVDLIIMTCGCLNIDLNQCDANMDDLSPDILTIYRHNIIFGNLDSQEESNTCAVEHGSLRDIIVRHIYGNDINYLCGRRE